MLHLTYGGLTAFRGCPKRHAISTLMSRNSPLVSVVLKIRITFNSTVINSYLFKKQNSYRVSVTHTRDVLARCSIFHCKRSLVDHFPSSWCDHMTSQQSVSLLITQYLHQPVNLGVRSCSAVSGERELSYLVSYALEIHKRTDFSRVGEDFSWRVFFTSVYTELN